MIIEVTTRQFIRALMTAYKEGVKADQNDENHTTNLEGMAEIVAQRLILTELYKDDYRLQQT